MRKLMLLMLLVLGGFAAGLFSPPAVEAAPPGGPCVTYCTTPNACGYVCCYQQCCGSNCVDLDCVPPPTCGGDN